VRNNVNVGSVFLSGSQASLVLEHNTFAQIQSVNVSDGAISARNNILLNGISGGSLQAHYALATHNFFVSPFVCPAWFSACASGTLTFAGFTPIPVTPPALMRVSRRRCQSTTMA
jgi:hypothetical protein